jgi:uncharacterized iron-regulated membrane protein
VNGTQLHVGEVLGLLCETMSAMLGLRVWMNLVTGILLRCQMRPEFDGQPGRKVYLLAGSIARVTDPFCGP